MEYPCKPQFYYLKAGCKGVYITRIYYHDVGSADGSTLFTDQDAVLERWTEHINSVLNRTSVVSDDAIKRLPEIECNVLLDESDRHGNKENDSTSVF